MTLRSGDGRPFDRNKGADGRITPGASPRQQQRPVVRRLPGPGPIVFGRGHQTTLVVDEMAFEGGNAYLLGAVLDRYFARHVSVNSFVETVLQSASRGEISRWLPHWGTRPTF